MHKVGASRGNGGKTVIIRKISLRCCRGSFFQGAPAADSEKIRTRLHLRRGKNIFKGVTSFSLHSSLDHTQHKPLGSDREGAGFSHDTTRKTKKKRRPLTGSLKFPKLADKSIKSFDRGPEFEALMATEERKQKKKSLDPAV